MSANPTKPNLGLNSKENGGHGAVQAPRGTSQGALAPGYHALQALLAFSSLHEQIRGRKSREQRGYAPAREDEQFVLDEVLQLVAQRALAITRADGVAIALADGDAVICRASAGGIAPDVGAHLDVSAGFSGVCFRSAEIVRCDDSESDERVNREACRDLGTRSMVAVPLCGQQSVIGLIEAFSQEPYGFDDGSIRSLNLLAELILAAMKPEEEDRLTRISQGVVRRSVAYSPSNGRRAPSVEDVQNILHRAKEPLPPDVTASEPTPAILTDYQKKNSRPRLVLVLFILLILGAGGAAWWRLQYARHAPGAKPQPSDQNLSGTDAAAVPPGRLSTPSITVPDSSQVTGVRHWSSVDSSTVVIDLKDQVQYEAHRLTDPERIYFDLHDTTPAPGLKTTYEIGDALLVRARVAQPTAGITRVVLETKGATGFSVSMEPSPYRLVVEVRAIGSSAKPRAKVDLFAPVTPDPANSFASVRRGSRAGAHPAAFRVVLDAGHGGWDLGTVGRTGVVEKDLVLDVVARLGTLVEKRLGAEVIYTRLDDNYLSLEKRAEIANLSQADVFLSIHANYSDFTSARGVETYYTNTYSSVNARSKEGDTVANALRVNWTNVDIHEKVRQSRRLALRVQQSLYRGLLEQSPGIRDRGVKKASYVVLTGATMPAVLAEISFVSSPDDERSLRDPLYRQQIAESLFKGLEGYGADLHRVNLASTSSKPSGL